MPLAHGQGTSSRIYGRGAERPATVRSRRSCSSVTTTRSGRSAPTAKRPFTVDGNVIRGPGVFDMKGGLAQIVFWHCRPFASSVLDLPLEPVIFINSDEEIGSRTSTPLHPCPGKVRRDALTCSSHRWARKAPSKPSARASAALRLRCTARPRMPGLDPGRPAPARSSSSSHVIQTLFALNDADRGITVNVGTVDGGLQPNVIAPHSKAVVDVRVPTVADGERIEANDSRPGTRLPRVCGWWSRAVSVSPSMEKTPRQRGALGTGRSLIGRELGLVA